MKTETFQICPYTGLRSFTEEESLYFKGREEQVDQITSQLEERKFLMLTGASGEGKSSLIYAGLIPNARAGFFKARYAQWTVVDFRPERSPLKNMAQALAGAFPLQTSTIETEMKRGFSSLVDLYLNADYFIDDRDASWIGLSEADKKLKMRKASNLLVLVDQFEEFFTNPENYHNETPSQDSQVVVNLILETARIARKKNLPIYVVCTMRSDYIGQCSSFRGLAEYIGFSQFFVPRLKRMELKQVIADPAELSGNRISKRLTERLVYDLSEGVDQLPILQHALSQIWLVANRGMEEMDLIHYAMVGGMSASELPPEDKSRFNEWFKTLPEWQQKFYQETGLHKVIENHANRLYESVTDVYNEANPEKPLPIKEAKNIVALAFSCLTKIDNSRAVRSRMSLQEITGVINRPDVSVKTVEQVLDIFRQEGNSFLRPFKTDTAKGLSGEAVLDITHESLIRNWGMLLTWANQEYQYYTTYLDLKKQLDLWKENGRSNGYLLPIGPLTYFENWYSTCKPNTAWINRYADREAEPSVRWKSSEDILLDLRSFLKKSADHVRISRVFMTYGAGKIAIALTLVILVVACGFYLYDARQKTNEKAIAKVKEGARLLSRSANVGDDLKSYYLLMEERLTPGSMLAYLQQIKDRQDRVNIGIQAYLQLLVVNKRFNGRLKDDLISEIRKGLAAGSSSQKDWEFNLAQRNRFIALLAYDDYYGRKSQAAVAIKEEAIAGYNSVLSVFRNGASNMQGNINQAINSWLTFGDPEQDQILALLNLISPLEGPQSKNRFETLFPKGSFEPDGIRPLDFSGGFHTLASLYASSGNVEKVNWCFDQLMAQPDYFSGKLLHDHTNVLGYLYQYGNRSAVPAVMAHIQKIYPANTPNVMFRDMLVRSGYLSHMFRVNFGIRRNQLEEGNLYLNLSLGSRDQFRAIAQDYEKTLSSIKDSDDRNYLLATHYKRLAIFEHKYQFDRGQEVDESYLDGLLSKAWDHFIQVSEPYLTGIITVEYPFFTQFRQKDMTRRQLFIYPDYMGGWLSLVYNSDIFYRYLQRKDLFGQAFRSPEDLDLIHHWIANRYEQRPFASAEAMMNNYPLSDSLLQSVLDMTGHHPAGKNFDGNLITMVLANNAFDRGDTTTGINLFKRFRSDDVVRSANRYEAWNKNFFLNQMMELSTNLARSGRIQEAVALTEKMETEPIRIISYAHAAGKVYEKTYSPDAFILLDSAISKWERTFNPTLPAYLEYRYRLIKVLNQVGGEKMIALGDIIFRSTPENRKFQAVAGKINGLSQRGDFYNALNAIPPTLTESQDMNCRITILYYASREREKSGNEPMWRELDQFFKWNEYVTFTGFSN